MTARRRLARPHPVLATGTARCLNAQGRREDRDRVDRRAIPVQHRIDGLRGGVCYCHLSVLRRRMPLARSQDLRVRK